MPIKATELIAAGDREYLGIVLADLDKRAHEKTDADFTIKLIENGDREYLGNVLDDLHKWAREKTVADFITELVENGDREYLGIVLADLHKWAREKAKDWDTAGNAFVRFLVATNATPDKLCARQAGRPKNAERNRVLLWVYETLDSSYGPELDKECAHLESKTLIGILSAALECGYYGSSRKGKSKLTEDRLTKIISKERAKRDKRAEITP